MTPSSAIPPARLPAATDFTRLAGCALPIQQAPIGFAAACSELPAAVAAAGGHGMVAGVRMPASRLAAILRELNSSTRAYGVNFIQVLLEDEALEVAAAEAPLIELYLGPPDPRLVARARSGGALVSRQVVSAEEARAAEDEGCDIVVARGIEAGGRSTGGIGLLPLLDAVLEAVSLPVVAAGGIATPRGVAACLAAGAAGARVGTRFLAAHEAQTHPVHAEGVIAARAEDAVITTRFSVGAPESPHRVLRSALEAAEAFPGDTVAWATIDGERVALPRFGPDNPWPGIEGAAEAMALYAGQSAGAVRRREPAAAIVADLARAVDAGPQPALTAAAGTSGSRTA